ncbi:Apolipoprotein A1/A4/E domain protein [Caloramator mitchellensis]|uniref:Apolipoprotein A1/A4/E domain protein n=1 Tax=Caloramator mitchellensis TaxID=908809 RepID=A0A0R3JRE5_CALMK|nr:tape measure protein [Caloramator mitchellensis]KRQ86059.1 Apolipoprotein A1/A4/E domain protein [Caloramator mitchellensis]
MKVGELLVAMGVDFSQYEKDLDRAEKRAQKTGLNIGDIFKNAMSFTLGMGIFEAVKSGFRAIAGSALDFNSMMERATIGFTTMLGSAEKTKSFLQDLQDFSDKTPFEFPELQESAKMLMAFGFEAKDVLPIMKAVSDAAAGLGGGSETINRIMFALGQMKTAGRVTAQDMMQLTSVGISAWDMLAKAIGKTVPEVKKLAEDGLIPADKAVNILVAGMEGRFKDLMKNMENTWQGITSTIKDTLRSITGKATEGAFEGLKNWLKGVRDWLQRFKNEMQQGGFNYAIGKMFGPNVLSDFQMISAALRSIWQIIVGVFNTIKNNWNIFGPIIKGVLLYFVSFKLATIAVNAATKAVGLFKSVNLALAGASTVTSGAIGFLNSVVVYYKVLMLEATVSTGIFSRALTAARAAIIAVWTALGPVGWATIAISALIVAGIALYKNWDKVRYYGLQAWGALKVGIAYVVYAIVSYYKLILGWIPVVGKALSNMQNKIKASIQNEKSIMAQRKSTYVAAGDELKQVKEAQDKVNQATKNASQQTRKNTNALKQQSKAASDNLQSFDEVHAIMQEIADESVKMPEANISELEYDFNNIEFPKFNLNDSLKETFGGIGDYFVTLWDDVKEKSSSKWDEYKKMLIDKWNNIKQNASEHWQRIKESIFEKISALDLASIWDRIKTNAIQKWEEFKTSVREVVNGVRKFSIEDTWNSIVSWFDTSIWNPIRTNAINKWTEFKTAIKPAIEQAKNFSIVDVWNSIKGWFENLWGDITTKAKEKWTEFKIAINPHVIIIKNSLLSIWDKLKTELPKIFLDAADKVKSKATEIADKIKHPFNYAKEKISEIIEDAKNWGKNLVKNIIDGINSMIDKVRETASKVASTISNFIGFHSPAKEGPGSDADKWAPNLMKMYAQGIYSNIGNIQAAVKATAGVLQGLNTSFENNIASAVGTAILQAMQINNSMNSTGQNKDIVIQIDGTTLARVLLPKIDGELQRLGRPALIKTT